MNPQVKRSLTSSDTHSKPNILMLVSRFPYPLEKGDKLRAYYQLKELSKQFNVTLVAISDAIISQDDLSEIKKYCSEVHILRINWLTKLIHVSRSFFNGLPFQVGYFFSWNGKRKLNLLLEQKEYKHIYSQLIRTSEYVKNIHRINKTIDYMDALSAGIKRRVNSQPFYLRWLFRSEAKRLTLYEQSVFDFFENRTIISRQDRDLIAHPDKHNIAVIPNGVDHKFFEEVERNEKFDLVFVGNMNYPPNIDAAHYIAENILKADPHLTLLISGSSPHPSVTQLAIAYKNITVTGWVDDIRTSYCSGKIFVAPMMIGTGMQNKLLEAMALNTPCITTSLSNNAIHATNEKEIIVAEDADSILSAIHDLLNNEAKRKKLALNGRNFVQEHYTWNKTTENLIKLMDPELEEECADTE